MGMQEFVEAAEKKDFPLAEKMLGELTIDSNNIGQVFKSQNGWPYDRSVDMLAKCWGRIPTSCHGVIARWASPDSKNSEDLEKASKRYVCLAGKLAGIDGPFSVRFLTHLFELAKPLPESAVKKFWLMRQGSEFPFTQWPADLLKPELVQWLAMEICVIIGKSPSSGSGKVDPKAREAVLDWRSRQGSVSADEMTRLCDAATGKKNAPGSVPALPARTEPRPQASPPPLSTAAVDRGRAAAQTHDRVGPQLWQVVEMLGKLTAIVEQVRQKLRIAAK